MTYVSFRRTRVAPENARWAIRVAFLALVFLGIGLVAHWITKIPEIAFYGFLVARVLTVAVIVIAVPGIVVPLALLLAPFLLAVYGVAHDREVWRTLWFWGITLVCEVAGVFALRRFGRRYDEREFQE